MKTVAAVREAFASWFTEEGAYVLVDGQFGSTGKGLMASVIAESCADRIDVVTTNAGPNSGHTAYLPDNGERIMTQQIPVASVVLNRLRVESVATYLNAGAVIDWDILHNEIARFGFHRHNLLVHPAAAVIEQCDRNREAMGGPSRIASTGKGVGAAIARKILREGNVAVNLLDWGPAARNWADARIFVETAQGFSLGINSRFYPHVTSRECTVQQAISDARIPWNQVRKVIACYRTFPIRVGNTDLGTSGDWYPDQTETTFEAIGQETEYTSVTKRPRRIATWSRQQFMEGVYANQPHAIFLNFANYLKDGPPGIEWFIRNNVLMDYQRVLGRPPETVLLGFGPKNSDVQVWTP